MTRISIIFRRGYDKGYKFICSYPNSFVVILIYYNKNIIFSEWLKNMGIIKYIFFKIQALLIYELDNKNHLKNINDQNFAHFMRGLRQRLLRYSLFTFIYFFFEIIICNFITELHVIIFNYSRIKKRVYCSSKSNYLLYLLDYI